MVKLRVTNWRCIEDLEVELAKINVFIGPNSTGKSSLAYAIYFASKSSRGAYDPSHLINQLYGHGFDKVVRIVGDKPQYPISIKIGESEFSVRPKGQELEVIKAPSSPWADEFLLPSKRVGYVQIAMLLSKIVSELTKKAETSTLVFFGGMFIDLLKRIPLLPPFSVFADDYGRAFTGLRLESVRGSSPGAGSYAVYVYFLFSLVELVFQDPYVNLQLPVELAPDGLLDFTITDSIMRKAPENSLVVVEEPEIHKNPLMVKDFTELIVRRALERKLTVVATTHSDIVPITIGKLVAKRELRPEDVKVYYFKRDGANPWTRVSEIKVYEDGTLETLPDLEELVTHLF